MIEKSIRKRQIILGTLKILSIIIAFLYFCAPSFAGWTIYKNAQIRNNDKHVFRIEKLDNGNVRATFQLKQKISGVFASKLPLYQVDENEVHDLQILEKGKWTNKEKDRWIRWKLYSGKGSLSDILLEFMNGKELTFQYYFPDGTIKETTFDLKGARKAIEEILK